MKVDECKKLNEIERSLASIVERYLDALRRLEVDVMPGFPAKTPGNGDPGGGSGGHGVSITERLAARPMDEVVDLETLRALPARAVRIVHLLLFQVGHIGAQLPPLHLDELSASRRLRWCLWSVRQLVAVCDVIDLNAPAKRYLSECHRLVVDAVHRCDRWGYTPSKPKVSRRDRTELAHDPTDQWCRSCLRVGARWPRYRGDLCQWCYRFQIGEGFLPPAEVIEARASGKRITEQMVARHRPSKPKRRSRRSKAAG